MKLAELMIGEKAKISDLSGCSLIIKKRLTQFGIDEDTEVSLTNKLPFGGPCFIKCHSQCISIRKCDAMNIEVCRGAGQ